MPYIKQEQREDLEDNIAELSADILDEGELNYTITKLCKNYLAKVGMKYKYLNTVIGVLECAKLEFYRKVASPYEDLKCKENGEV